MTMIRFKSATPRVQLILDLILFTLFALVVITSLVAHAASHTDEEAHSIWLHIHVFLGFALTTVITLHLLLHQSWIAFQIRRLL
jgi:hypothetical protein